LTRFLRPSTVVGDEAGLAVGDEAIPSGSCGAGRRGGNIMVPCTVREPSDKAEVERMRGARLGLECLSDAASASRDMCRAVDGLENQGGSSLVLARNVDDDGDDDDDIKLGLPGARGAAVAEVVEADGARVAKTVAAAARPAIGGRARRLFGGVAVVAVEAESRLIAMAGAASCLVVALESSVLMAMCCGGRDCVAPIGGDGAGRFGTNEEAFMIGTNGRTLALWAVGPGGR